jgi:hypothetical protein
VVVLVEYSERRMSLADESRDMHEVVGFGTKEDVF